VTEASTPPELVVPLDQYQIVRADTVLIAELKMTFALCFYDAVQESGALLHMQVGRPGRISNPELTDNTLSTDLLLMDRCLGDLRRSDTKARNWQAKFVGHADMEAGGHDRLAGMQSFIEAFLDDCGVRLVASTVHTDAPQHLRFRPSMGQLHCQPQR
jgi:chemotaxis receptor (MCP) glutamine deamidase CheD